MKELLQHELSAAFPGMTKVELAALTEDIADNGQREPITLFQGMVLDGWHRYCACRDCGRVPNVVELPAGVDPVAFVKSRNLHRRHLSASQRAAAIVACTKWREGGAPGAGVTVKEMAREAEVSPRTIQQAKVAVEAGQVREILDGKMSVKEAAASANKKPAQTGAKNSGQGKGWGEARKPATGQPAKPDGMVWVSEVELEELKFNLAEVVAENEEMGRVFDADDKLKAATDEIKRLRIEVESLQLRVDGLMMEKAEAVRSMKRYKALADKAGHAAEPVTIETEGVAIDESGLPE